MDPHGPRSVSHKHESMGEQTPRREYIFIYGLIKGHNIWEEISF